MPEHAKGRVSCGIRCLLLSRLSGLPFDQAKGRLVRACADQVTLETSLSLIPRPCCVAMKANAWLHAISLYKLKGGSVPKEPFGEKTIEEPGPA